MVSCADMVIERSPRDDFTPIANAYRQVVGWKRLNDVRTTWDKSTEDTLFAYFSRRTLRPRQVAAAIGTVRGGENIECVDLTACNGWTANNVGDLLAMKHVRAVCIAEMSNSDEIRKELLTRKDLGDIDKKLIFESNAVFFDSIANRNSTIFQSHRAFYAHEYAVRLSCIRTLY
eukprot:TRINITY_DN6809_c0_g1_i1.p2 TRINITY_DN6809_c0_g1~~TRINITY_DN6809_c0_g1_i1.p2  ORF type:complete len:174 (+),score=19.11 TRINITY_DN6809_c0_g1_i1:790-1311(+)